MKIGTMCQEAQRAKAMIVHGYGRRGPAMWRMIVGLGQVTYGSAMDWAQAIGTSGGYRPTRTERKALRRYFREMD